MKTNKTMRVLMGSIKSHEKKRQSESSIDSTAHNKILQQQKQLNGSNHHIPIILTPNTNRLISPVKRHHLANWIKKEDLIICCLPETILLTEINTDLG
jgi:hypothetical protein